MRRLSQLTFLFILISTTCFAEIKTITVTEKEIPVTRSLDGKVEAINSATVSAQTTGRVAEILFDIGDKVAQGETIIRLVSEEQQASLQQAEAAVMEVNASLALEQKENSRLRNLFDKKLISQADIDRSEGKLKTLLAQIEKAQGALRKAKQQLDYTTVQAPFAGIVSERHIELGEAVSPGIPLMSGFDPKQLRVVVDIPQDIYNKIKGAPKINILAGEDTQPPSDVTFYPVTNPSTGSIKARLGLTSPTNLQPGQWVKVDLLIGKTPGVLIPLTAAFTRAQIDNVFVKTDAGFQLRKVRLGKQYNDELLVNAGLNSGEEIVTNPTAVLINGGKHE